MLFAAAAAAAASAVNKYYTSCVNFGRHHITTTTDTEREREKTASYLWLSCFVSTASVVVGDGTVHCVDPAQSLQELYTNSIYIRLAIVFAS